MKRKKAQSSGFTLLEILIALMILMIGLTSVILVFAQGIALQTRSKRQMNTARLAQSVMAEIQFLADEYNRLPDQEKVSSHAGFSDQYSVEISYSKMDTRPDNVPETVPHTTQPFRVRIHVVSTFRGKENRDTFHSAVVVTGEQ